MSLDEDEYKQILKLQTEVENLKWQKSIIEAEKFQKIIEIREHTTNSDKMKEKLSNLE